MRILHIALRYNLILSGVLDSCTPGRNLNRGQVKSGNVNYTAIQKVATKRS